MKKLKLSKLNLGDAEVLTREQLKTVLGGMGSGGSGSGGNSGSGNGENCCVETGCERESCFYSGPEGCGIITCEFLMNGSGPCIANFTGSLTPQPCGYA